MHTFDPVSLSCPSSRRPGRAITPCLLALCAALAAADTATSQCSEASCEIRPFMNNAGLPHDLAGWSVAARGDLAVAGAPGPSVVSTLAVQAGAAYVFERGLDGLWRSVAILANPSPEPLDDFGRSVAIGEDIIVVGDPTANENGAEAGAVFVFVRPPGGWGPQGPTDDVDLNGVRDVPLLPDTKLLSTHVPGPDDFAGNTHFATGTSVAIAPNDEKIYVGVPFWNDHYNFAYRRREGRVLVYLRGASWSGGGSLVTRTEDAQLARAENGEPYLSGFTSLGWTLAVATNAAGRDRVVTCGTADAAGTTGTEPGGWVFDEPADGWLGASGVDPQASALQYIDASGVPVSVEVKTHFLSLAFGGDGGRDQGWGVSLDLLGPSLAAVGSIYSPNGGSVRVYRESGSAWGEYGWSPLFACEAVVQLGTSVAFADDGTLFSGQFYPGPVYAFARDDLGTPELEDDTWTVAQRIQPRLTVPGYLALTDSFGFSLATTGDTCVIGKPMASSLYPSMVYSYTPGCACLPLPAGATNWWPLDGNFLDVVGAQDGSPIGSPVFNDYLGPFIDDQCFLYGNGVDVGTTAGNFGTGDFTIELWRNRTNNFDTPILDKLQDGVAGWIFETPGWGVLRFRIQSATGNVTLVANVDVGGLTMLWRWEHLAVTREALSATQARYRIYHNGTPVLTQDDLLVDVDSANPMRFLGGGYAGGGYGLDEVTYYGRTLRQEELTDIAFSFISGKCKVLDVDPPTVAFDAPADGQVVGGTSVGVDVLIADASPTSVSSSPAGVSGWLPSGGGSLSGTVPLASEGSQTISVTAVDEAGNVGGNSVAVVRDTIAPVVVVLSPVEDAVLGSTPSIFSAQVNDATGTSLSFAGNTFSFEPGGGFASAALDLEPGLNSVEFLATDAAGNSTVAVRNVILDLTAPLVTILSPADGATFGPGEPPVEVTATVSDLTQTTVTSTPQGLSAVLPAGGGTVVGSVDLAEGFTTIVVTASDETDRSGSASIAVLLDTTPPALAIESPPDGLAVRGTIDFDVAATDVVPGTGVDRVEFFVDGGLVSTDEAAPFQSTLDTTALADGGHVLSARAVDGKGNGSTDAALVEVDNTLPVVAIGAPADGALVSGTFPFQATGLDSGSGLVVLEMQAAGMAPSPVYGSLTFFPPVSTATGESQVDTTGFADGALLLVARAVDDAGNFAVAHVTVEVDNQAPSKALVSPADGAVVSGDLEIVADSQDADLASLEIFVDGVSVASSWSAPLVVTIDTTARLDGPMSILVVATDAAGNSTACTAVVTVDNVRSEGCVLTPRTLNLKSKGSSKSVTLHVEGVNLALAMPTEEHAWELRVAGGNPVPSTSGFAGDDQLQDADGDGIGDLQVKFDRQLLTSAIQAGIAAGLLQSGAVITVEVFVDGVKICEEAIRIVD